MFNLDEFVETAGDRMRRVGTGTFAPKRGLSACTSAQRLFSSGRFRALPPTIRRSGSFETVNCTLCGDQLLGTIVNRIYEWAPLAEFLARVMGKTPPLSDE